MTDQKSARDFLPDTLNMKALRQAAQTCQGCELYEDATQTVFGQGLKRAWLMLVGEMPGDREDLAGQPFVGPAGRLLYELLEQADIQRDEAYVTNAVKHFRWQPRGKRRLHKRPGARHVEACRPWLQAEILTIKPRLIVCLGATAAQMLLGRDFRITKQRGKLFSDSEAVASLMATYHPAAILRAPDKQHRDAMREQCVGDLRHARETVGE